MDIIKSFFSPYVVAAVVALVLLPIGALMGRKSRQVGFIAEVPWVIGCILFSACGVWIPVGIVLSHDCSTDDSYFVDLQYSADGTIINKYQCTPNTWWPDNINSVPRGQLERSFAMRAHPITANPKVRNLAYQVDTRVVDFNKFYRGRAVSQVDAGSELQHLTRKTLFEFNEQHSKELAAFYNPLDELQQARFGTLLTSFAQPILAEHGITIALTRFDIE